MKETTRIIRTILQQTVVILTGKLFDKAVKRLKPRQK